MTVAEEAFLVYRKRACEGCAKGHQRILGTFGDPPISALYHLDNLGDNLSRCTAASFEQWASEIYEQRNALFSAATIKLKNCRDSAPHQKGCVVGGYCSVGCRDLALAVKKMEDFGL